LKGSLRKSKDWVRNKSYGRILLEMSSQTIAYFINNIKKSRELNRKEKDVLIARLSKRTLIKVGRKYHLSGERIRQIEKEALRKIIKGNSQLLLFD
jgi:DNA-directed RNA polymerase sigma subunit (sigma70/sigma32)